MDGASGGCYGGGGAGTNVGGVPSVGNYYVSGGIAPSTTQSLFYNYANTVSNNGAAASGDITVEAYSSTDIFDWARERTYIAAQPAITYGAVTAASSTNTLVATPNPYTASNTVIDVGQVSTGNTVISNGYAGTTSYTGNWLWSVGSGNAVVIPNTIIAGLPITNNALTFTLNQITSNSFNIGFNGVNYAVNAIGTANTIYGVWTIKAYAGDANGDTSPSPTLTNTITINPALVAGVLTETNTVIDNNQYSSLGASSTGGSGSVSYNFFTGAGCVNANFLGSGSSYVVNPSSPTSYSFNGVDSATTKNVVCSSTNTITVRSTPTLATLLPSNALLDLGQAVSYNVVLTSASGGSSFTVNLIQGGLASSLTGQSAGTLVFATNIPATTGSKTFYAIANDLTPTTTFGFGTPSNIIAVNTALVSTSISSPLSPTVLDVSQQLTISVTAPTTGTAPYTYSWAAVGSCPNFGGSSSSSFTYSPNGASASCQFTVTVTDSASTSESYTATTPVITVKNQLFSTGWTASNTPITLGNYQVLTATITGGNYPYTYCAIVSNTAGVVTNVIYVNSITSNSYTFVQLAAWLAGTFAGTFTANLIVTDSATTTNTVTNTLTYTTPYVALVVYDQNAVANPAITFPTLTGIPACANTIGGTCIGNDVLAGTITLNNNLFVVGNFLLTSGSTLNSKGFSAISTQAFITTGATINTGFSTFSTNGIGIVSGSGTNAGNIQSIGSSGGGGGASTGTSGGNGGNTIANGGAGGTGGGVGSNGNKAIIPPLTLSNAILWCSNPNWLVGASGGGGGASPGATGGNGGAGGAGICIEGNTVNLGTITTNGQAGSGGSYVGGDGGGGGGAGTIIIMYGSGGYNAGTYTQTGGAGQIGTGVSGGNGGAGNYIVSSAIALPMPIVQQYYPINLYTTSSDPTATFTLYQTLNGITNAVTGQIGVANLNYTPSPTQPSGLYLYNVVETNAIAANSILFNISINMDSLNNGYPQFNSTPENFTNFPLALYLSNSLWNSPPKSWIFDTYTANANGNVVDIKGSNSVTLPLNVKAVYPFTSFNLTPNTGLTKNSLSLMPFLTFTSTNTLYSRAFITVNSLTETYTPLNAIIQYSAIGVFNNYSINLATTMNLNNTNTIYMANSAYSNPYIILQNQTGIVTSTNYNPRTDNWWANTVYANAVEPLNTYLPSLTNASQYTFTVYGCVGYASGDMITSYRGAVGSQVSVQSYLIPSRAFSMPLQNGYPYGFVIQSPYQKVLLTSSTGVWTYPSVTLYINCTNGVPMLEIPNVSVSCKSTYNNIAGTILATCTGVDTQNMVTGWNIQFVNQSTLLTATVLNSINITGNYFLTSYLLPSNSSQYHALITAHVGTIYDPDWVWNLILNLLSPKPLNSDFVFVGLILILLPVALGYFNRTGLLMLEMFTIVVGQSIGLLSFTLMDVAGFIVLCGLVIVIDEARS
jgi:hypothetical protein